MKMFQKLSIRNKLIGIMVLVTFPCIGNRFNTSDSESIQQPGRKVQLMMLCPMQILYRNFQHLPLAFNMPESADQVIKEYKHEPGLLNIIVYDNKC